MVLLLLLFILYTHKYNVNGVAKCMTRGMYFIGVCGKKLGIPRGKSATHLFFISNHATIIESQSPAPN